MEDHDATRQALCDMLETYNYSRFCVCYGAPSQPKRKVPVTVKVTGTSAR